MGKFLSVVVTIMIVAALVIGVVTYENWAYGDWTCIFKHCVQVKP